MTFAGTRRDSTNVARFDTLFTPRRRHGIRLTVTVGLFAIALVACGGMLSGRLFAQPSTVKWALTVAIPVGAIALVLSRRPVTLLATVGVSAFPFSKLTYHFGSFDIPLFAVLLVLGVAAGMLSSPSVIDPLAPTFSSTTTRLVPAAGVMLLLIFQGLARGPNPMNAFGQLATVMAMAYIIARACALDRYAPTILLTVFLIGGAIQGSMSLAEFQSGHTFNPYGGGVASFSQNYFFGYDGVFRPAGAFTDPISLGNYLAITSTAGVAMASQRILHPSLRVLYVVCTALALSGLVVTFSRMSWVGAAVGILVGVLISGRGLRARQAVGLAVGGTFLLSAVIGLAGSQLTQRFDSILHPTRTGVETAQGDKTRQMLWAAAEKVFYSHPLGGVGFGNLNPFLQRDVADSSVFTHSHSTYLQYLAEGGILGGLALCVLFWAATREIATRLKQSQGHDVIARATGGAMVAMAVCWSTDYTVRYTSVLLSMAFPVVLLAASTRMDHGMSARQ